MGWDSQSLGQDCLASWDCLVGWESIVQATPNNCHLKAEGGTVSIGSQYNGNMDIYMLGLLLLPEYKCKYGQIPHATVVCTIPPTSLIYSDIRDICDTQ